ncbi:MAG: ABC transporter ATP-binding protein [Pyrodictiaceae archaeon]
MAVEEEAIPELPRDMILVARDLRVWFPLRRSLREFLARIRRYVRAVDGINFHIKRGEVFCLVGESGSGKTTTGRALLGLAPISSGHVYYRPKKEVLEELREMGVVERDGVIDLYTLGPREFRVLRRDIQMIYQDPFGSLNPRYRVKDILEEPLIIHKLVEDKEQRMDLIARMLELVKLVPPEDFMERFPHQLSGGQRQRVAVARALILNPSFVIADEPVSMLDVSIRAEILELMLDLKKKFNLTYLFITHDLAVARYICDRIGVLYLGKLVEVGEAREIIADPLHPYTRALVAAILEPNPENRKKLREVPIKGEIPSAVNIPPGCRFHPRCVVFEQRREEFKELCPRVEPPLVEVKPGRYVACFLYDEVRRLVEHKMS